MYNVFGSMKSLMKRGSVSIDNIGFQLHYKATTNILMAFSLLITLKQFFGEPIHCIVDDITLLVMNAYCWIHSTYTIPTLTAAKVGKEVPHPGISNPFINGPDDPYEIKYHKYYQWVALFLFLQAIMFYIPRYLWRVWEAGKLKHLVTVLQSPIVDDDVKRKQKKMLVTHFSLNLHNHNFYAFRFFFCEVLNFVNVIGQIYFTDRFLGYEFTTYGSRVLEYTEQEFGTRHDPMDQVFPKVTKCTFHKFGPSGSIQKVDGLCVLPLNVLNEKICIFLWFWFILVAVISGLVLIYRLATFIPAFRGAWFAPLSTSDEVLAISRKCKIGDWFLLSQLGKNMDPIIYKEFITDLADKLQGRSPMS